MKKNKSTQMYEWDKMDIERKMGMRGGKHTSVNFKLSLLIGVFMTLITYGILFPVREMPVADSFFKRDPTPYLIVFLSCTALSVLFVKWRKLLLQEKPLSFKLFPPQNSVEFTKDLAKDILSDMTTLVDEPEHFILLNRIKEALSTLRFMGEGEISKALRAEAQKDEDRISSSYRIIKLLVWLIPLLGIAGTSWGLFQALQGLGQDALSLGGIQGEVAEGSNNLLQHIVLNLAEPLNITLIALTASFFIHTMSINLRKREERLLGHCNEYCHTHIISRIPLSYGDRLEQIRARISHRRTGKALNALWKELKADSSLEEEESKKHIQTLFDKARGQIAAHRRNRWIGYTFMLTFMVSCLLLSWTLNHYGRLRDEIRVKLQQAFQAEDPVKINTLIDEIEKKHRLIFTPGEISKARYRSQGVKEKVDEQRGIFETAFKRLEEIRQTNFKEDPEIIEQLLKDALAAFEYVPLADQDRLLDVQTLWQEKKLGVTLESKQEMSNILNQLTDEFKKMGESSPPDLINGWKRIQKIDTLISRGMEILNVPRDMRDDLENFITRFKSVKKFWAKRKAVLSDLEKSENLENYLNGLKTFTENFPNDSLNNDIVKIHVMTPLYDDLLSNPADHELESRFWHAAAEHLEAFEQNRGQHMNEVIKDIKKLEEIHAFVNLWECVVNQPNQPSETWYFMGEPTQRFADGVKSYAGGAYVPLPDDVQPKFPAKFIITVHVEDLKKSSHCDYVQQMIARILDDLTMETMLKEIRQLDRQPFSSMLKLDLLKYFAKPLTTLAGRENAGEFADMADLLEKSTLKHHWLCNANPAYETENKKAAVLVNDILAKTDIVRSYMVKIKVESTVLKRLPQWIGFVDLEEEGKLHLKPGAENREIWVLRNGESPSIFVTREQLKGGVLTSFDHNRYMPGEPLFAPTGSRATWEILHSMLTDLELTGDLRVEWPLAWPVNVRQHDVEL